eukprot:9090098-Alexandrium_andersonii.AAC.1
MSLWFQCLHDVVVVVTGQFAKTIPEPVLRMIVLEALKYCLPARDGRPWLFQTGSRDEESRMRWLATDMAESV